MPSLKAYNTFGLDVRCSQLVRVRSKTQLEGFILENNPLAESCIILGGGSNVLLLGDIERPVLRNEIKERSVVSESKKHVIVRAGGGENWHRFVRWCIREGYGGLENLSLIPGSVGAAPMQNIGAYGVEIKDVFHSLEAVNLKTGKTRVFKKAACAFGYRTSVFKERLKGKYFITSVNFKLDKIHQLSLSYGAIQTELSNRNVSNPTIKDVSDVVIAIRRSKLPDPKEIGNSGSFFKNPIIKSAKAKNLKKDYPTIPVYPQAEKMSKISAGWLIEQCGWKGKKMGGAGCYKKHALILINRKNATPQDILKLCAAIQESVSQKFGIDLIPEVNFIK